MAKKKRTREGKAGDGRADGKSAAGETWGKASAAKTWGEAPALPSPPAAPTRRLLWFGLFALLLLAAGGWLAWLSLSPPAAPLRHTPDQNVLLVTIDTWRADALGASGSGKVATPNLDRLAALGTRFDFAHAHAVITLPSHASILTGLYPYQHGVRDNAGFRLQPATRTLAASLRERGVGDGRLYRIVRARLPLRPQRGIRRVRRALRQVEHERRLRDAGAARGRGRGRRDELDRTAEGEVVCLGPPVRPARPVPAAAAVRSGVRRSSLLRRGGVHGQRARIAPRRRPRCIRPPDVRRRHRRPRRRPGRSRRDDARPLRLRGDAQRPADRRPGGPLHARVGWHGGERRGAKLQLAR